MKSEHPEKPTFHVGERIRKFREQKGISTNKLANLAGISQSYLRDIELENKNPTVEILYLLCQALDISLSQFFCDENSALLLEDPLLKSIYQLNAQQRKALLAFLKTLQ